LAGCGKSGPDDGSSASPSAVEPVGLTVPTEDLPTVEGDFAKEATLTFPLKPGATPPPVEEPADGSLDLGEITIPETEGEDAAADDAATAPASEESPAATEEPTGASEEPSEAPEGSPTSSLSGLGAGIGGPILPAGRHPADEPTATPSEEPTPADSDLVVEPVSEAPATEGDDLVVEPVEEVPATEGETTEDPEASPTPTESPYIDPPDSLQAQVLKEGEGETLKDGWLVTAYYKGQIWGSATAFEDVFAWGKPQTFPYGSSIMEGWYRGLKDKKIGSRVLVIIPPAQGFGVAGAESYGVSGTDTIVYVFDIIAQFDPDAQAQADATPTGADVDVTISGELGGPATVVVPGGTTPPEEVTTTVIATGTGPKVAEGDSIIVQVDAVDWTNQDAGNSWAEGASATAITVSATGSSDPDSINAFTQLVDVPVGSRVLIELPGKADTYQPIAAVVDIVALVPTS
jgi:peptidylprolyl isomerase